MVSRKVRKGKGSESLDLTVGAFLIWGIEFSITFVSEETCTRGTNDLTSALKKGLSKQGAQVRVHLAPSLF